MTRHMARKGPETGFQDAVIELAQLNGWHVAHFRPARVLRHGKETHETPVAADGKGWPDLVLVRHRVIYRECKSLRGKLREDQVKWRDWLLAAGADWDVWDPSMWDLIDETLIVRRH
jgi:hypothetical protein